MNIESKLKPFRLDPKSRICPIALGAASLLFIVSSFQGTRPSALMLDLCFVALSSSLALALLLRSTRLKRRLELKKRQFDSVIAINQKMSSLLDPQQMFGGVVALAMELTESQRGILLIRSGEEDQLRMVAQQGFKDEERLAEQNEFLRRPDSLEAFARGEILTTDPANLCVPLRYQGKLRGACYLEKHPHLEFTPDDADTLSVLMAQAAISTENYRLYELSITDGLTGGFTHRHFLFLLQQELDRAFRYKRELTLLMIDVDHFKEINDCHGHLAGDRVLAELTGILGGSCRNVDVIARYGGDEFAVILPETKSEDAMIVAERIRSRVENHLFRSQGTEIRTTVSLGVAGAIQTRDKEALIGEADEALYASKESGRNRITLRSRCKAG